MRRFAVGALAALLIGCASRTQPSFLPALPTSGVTDAAVATVSVSASIAPARTAPPTRTAATASASPSISLTPSPTSFPTQPAGIAWPTEGWAERDLLVIVQLSTIGGELPLQHTEAILRAFGN